MKRLVGVVNTLDGISYAIVTGWAERDPSGDLRGALTPVKVKHHASITNPKLIGGLLRSIEGFSGSCITKCA